MCKRVDCLLNVSLLPSIEQVGTTADKAGKKNTFASLSKSEVYAVEAV